jgi:hypothetical protein
MDDDGHLANLDQDETRHLLHLKRTAVPKLATAP